MDPALLAPLLFVITHNDDDDLITQCATGTGIVFDGTLGNIQAKRRHRHQRRLYLVRPNLIHNPRGQTSLPRLDRRSLDAEGGLGLVLHYMSSTMREKALQEIFAIVPSSASRYINFALQILDHTLVRIPEARIIWPIEVEEYQSLADMIKAKYPLLRRGFGFIDGLKIPIGVSSDPDWENATYNGWLHDHFISCVFVFSPRGMHVLIFDRVHGIMVRYFTGAIIACVLNAPGSWHDSDVAQAIYEKLRERTPNGFYLIADTAFPRNDEQVNGKIRAAPKAGDRYQGTPARIQAFQDFTVELTSSRQAAEWGMRDIQGSWGRLRLPLDANDTAGRQLLLRNCSRMTNIRAQRIGISEIRNTYMPAWQENRGDALIWEEFEMLLFGQIRRHDRVARFHIRLQEELNL
jgi:hypothetical protein